MNYELRILNYNEKVNLEYFVSVDSCDVSRTGSARE